MPADTMLGAAFSPDNVPAADVESLNSNADALFDPTISAWIDRLRTMVSRNLIRSYETKATPASSKAEPLTSMFIHVSFLEIEPRAAVAYYNRACFRAKSGKREEALVDLQKALQLEPFFVGEALGEPDLKGLVEDPKIRRLLEPQGGGA